MSTVHADGAAVVDTFSIPTVSVEAEEDHSKVWYAPTSTSDFDLTWVQFVMQQYFKNQNIQQECKVRNFSVVNMAGSPEEADKEAAKR